MRSASLTSLLLAAWALAWPIPGATAGSADRIWVAGGHFTMGSEPEDVDYARRLCVSERLDAALRLRGCADEALFANELGARRVYVSGFGLDRLEVSRADYQRCMLAGACSPSHATGFDAETDPDWPITSLTFAQAAELCAFRGGRLPREAEWERAARGVGMRRFPWGMHYNPNFANHGRPRMDLDPTLGRAMGADGYWQVAPRGAFAAGVSPTGALDMAGNVWEWTADGYAPLSEVSERIDPEGAGDTGLRVVRGGSYLSPAFTLRVTHRDARPEGGHWADVGVRCAYDPG